MPKKTKRRSRKNSKKTFRKYKKSRSKFGLAKGITTTDKTHCCICNKEIITTNGLIPAKCLAKYGAIRAHRICQECWWDPVNGFAKEGTNHACPGCVKGLPLNGPQISAPIFVDLTED
jgi:hypothetical protein